MFGRRNKSRSDCKKKQHVPKRNFLFLMRKWHDSWCRNGNCQKGISVTASTIENSLQTQETDENAATEGTKQSGILSEKALRYAVKNQDDRHSIIKEDIKRKNP